MEESGSGNDTDIVQQPVTENAVADDQVKVSQFDDVCLVSDDNINGTNDVPLSVDQSLDTQLTESLPVSPVNGSNQDSKVDTVTTATIRSMSSASNSSQEVMYSIGNTPLASPVKVPKSLPDSDKLLLVEMEQQNQVLENVKLIEEKYLKKITELTESNKVEEEIRHKLEEKIKLLQETVEKQQEDFATTISDVKSKLGSKLDQMTKAAETSKKDLESMVRSHTFHSSIFTDPSLNH